jgi:hypothetical protein
MTPFDKAFQEVKALAGKSGDVDHPSPVQTDHPKLTSYSCCKRAVFLC